VFKQLLALSEVILPLLRKLVRFEWLPLACQCPQNSQ
jgi:hypothetical protein